MLIGQNNSRNGFINGRFDYWQRATTWTMAASNTYIADRWGISVSADTGTIAAGTFSQQAGSNFQLQSYFARFTNTSTGTQAGNSFAVFFQRVEDVNSYAGKTVTVSFWISSTIANKIIAGYGFQYFGSGGSAQVNIAGQTKTLNSSITRYDFTFTIPSTSGKTIGAGSYLQIGLFLACGPTQGTNFGLSQIDWQGTGNIDIYGAMIVEGESSSDFDTKGLDRAQELQYCQRYYWTGNAAAGAAYPTAAGASAWTTTNFPVMMRTTPTCAIISNVAGSNSTGTIVNGYPFGFTYRADQGGSAGNFNRVDLCRADAEL